MKILGIDLGSREVKVVLMKNRLIIDKFKISTISFYKDFCNWEDGIKVDILKLGLKDIDTAISTGYGRNNIDLKEFTAINELKAHVYGVIYQTKLTDFILLDIGGQDIKIAKIKNSMIVDFELNDKCAASCGRYLENMAAILEIPVEEMAQYIDEPILINSTCAVFSESELIGKIAEGYDFKRLCAGVNYSLYKRFRPMLSNFMGNLIVLSGGVSKSFALRHFIKPHYDEVVCLEEPQYNGAIGCCFYGMKKNISKISANL